MKNTVFKIIAILFILNLVSCQDVVEVDLETAKERLVIEALINWENGTTGNEQTIKLTKTSSFYNNQIIPATGANVVIKNLNTQQEFDFIEIQDGIYQTSNFTPEIDIAYELEVGYNNEVYKATSTMLDAPVIQDITQSIVNGLSVEDPEVNVIFQDFENQTDWYRIIFKYYKNNENEQTDYEDNVFKDDFIEGNSVTLFYENEELQTDDRIEIKLYKISERYFNFITKLQQQASTDFGPFALPPINVKGNIINATNLDNYPYGYFSLNKINTETYIFQ